MCTGVKRVVTFENLCLLPLTLLDFNQIWSEFDWVHGYRDYTQCDVRGHLKWIVKIGAKFKYAQMTAISLSM